MKIDITKISLDVANFRHKQVSSEREAMQILLSDEKTHKVSELAQDIINMGGLDPSSLLIVTEDSAQPGHYTALEGNRRLTALKTLASPELANGTPAYAIFKSLSGTFLSLGIRAVEAVVLDRRSAAEWIKRKHNNAMGGKGVVEWNAVAKARSEASEGRYSRWLSALNYLEAQGHDTTRLLDGVANKTTTVERVFQSTYMSSILGLTFDRTGSVSPENGDTTAACRLLAAMFQAMGDKEFVETRVTSSDLQRDFIEDFEPLNVKLPAAPPFGGGGSPAAGGTNPGGSSGGGGSGQPNGGSSAGGKSGSQPLNANPGKGGTARSKPVKQRKFLASKGLRINNHGLNKLYDEMRKLNVENNPHIGSAMVRIFLEKATMVFLLDLSVPCLNPSGWTAFDIKLKDKVKAALHVVDPTKSNAQLTYARDVANGVNDKLHSLDLLNRAIHDHQNLPSAFEIVQIWDRYHPYFAELFKELEKNGK